MINIGSRIKCKMTHVSLFIFILSGFLYAQEAAEIRENNGVFGDESPLFVVHHNAPKGSEKFVQVYVKEDESGKPSLSFWTFDKVMTGNVLTSSWDDYRGTHSGRDTNQMEQITLAGDDLPEGSESIGEVRLKNPETHGEILRFSYEVLKPIGEGNERRVRVTLTSVKDGGSYTKEVVLKKDGSNKWGIYDEHQYTEGGFYVLGVGRGGETKTEEFKINAVGLNINVDALTTDPDWNTRIDQISLKGRNGKGKEVDKTEDISHPIKIPVKAAPKEASDKTSYNDDSKPGVCSYNLSGVVIGGTAIRVKAYQLNQVTEEVHQKSTE